MNALNQFIEVIAEAYASYIYTRKAKKIPLRLSVLMVLIAFFNYVFNELLLGWNLHNVLFSGKHDAGTLLGLAVSACTVGFIFLVSYRIQVKFNQMKDDDIATAIEDI